MDFSLHVLNLHIVQRQKGWNIHAIEVSVQKCFERRETRKVREPQSPFDLSFVCDILDRNESQLNTLVLQ